MKAKRVLEKITENWVPKILCFIAALLIYMFHQTSTISRKTFAVPLKIIADGVVIPAGGYPDFVRVTVRAGTDSLSIANEDTVTAELNLNSYATEGDHSVPVTIKLAYELQSVEPLEVRVRPEYINLSLEEKMEKYVEISSAVTGKPSKGYAVTDISATPSTVLVSGPSSIVSAIKKIDTEKIDVTGATQSKRVNTRIKNENPYLFVNTSSDVVVNYIIEPISMVMNFQSVPVAIKNLNERFSIATEISPVSFDLNGTEVSLSDYALSDDTVYIDCANITAAGVYELPIDFYLPAGVTVSGLNADTINIEVVVSEQSDSVAKR